MNIFKNDKGYIVFLGLLAAVPPLATDMYLPAIPTIAKNWNISANFADYSLVLWFVSFSICLLIFGTISDKFGRKPVLLTGLGIFVIASFLCATAANIWQLIIWRILQGAGAAAPSSMCMAICRDSYDGEKRKRILAYISIILAVAPIVSPTIGSIFLKIADWRFIFMTQAVLMTMTALLSLQFKETISEKMTGGIIHIFGRYKNLISNRNYTLANTTMGLLIGPFFGYIAFSPIVYIQIYHLSTFKFGILFAINASMAMFGAFLCTRLIKLFSDTAILTTGIIGCVLSAAGIIIFGSINYIYFVTFMSIFTFCCGMSRPLSTNLILSQVNTDIGSASGFMVFYTFVVGSICMAAASAEWVNPIVIFGIITFSLTFIVLLIWPFLLKFINNQKS